MLVAKANFPHGLNILPTYSLVFELNLKTTSY